MQLPCNGVKQTDETGFADSPAEEGVGGERSEGVVADFGVSRRCATVDKLEVIIS